LKFIPEVAIPQGIMENLWIEMRPFAHAGQQLDIEITEADPDLYSSILIRIDSSKPCYRVILRPPLSTSAWQCTLILQPLD
jgi:hypothetical protein